MPCPPRMRGCRADCLHRALVEDYRAARERDEIRRDEETIGYATENANYYRENGMVTFRSWLEQNAGQGAYSRYPEPPE